jgi:hypothetical protein
MFAMVFKYFSCVFASVVPSVSLAFRHVFQTLYLDVSKVDQVLHIL